VDDTPAATGTLVTAGRGLLAAMAGLPLLCGVLVWNGIYELHVSRGEKQYLLEHARSATGRGEAPSMQAIMGETVRAGARQASWWALVAAGLGMGAAGAGLRAGRRTR
jgi:hypothetical protein